MAATVGLERELKWRLDADGHAVLARVLGRLLGPPRGLEQRNRFYDSPRRRLESRRASLRLRLENQRLLQTGKRYVSAGDGLHQHQEEERWLPTSLWPECEAVGSEVSRIIPLPDDIRRDLDGEELRCLGGFDNHRLEWRRGDELIALDQTTFPQRTDHELEVETTDADDSRAWWRTQLIAWGVNAVPQLETKLHRFIAQARAQSPTTS